MTDIAVTLNGLKTKEIRELLSHGFQGKISRVFTELDQKLTKMTDELEHLGTKNFLIWKKISDNLPSKFFTEIILCEWNGNIYGIGPKCEKYICVLKIDLESAYDFKVIDLETDDDIPLAVVLFRKMPANFIFNGHIYLGFIDGEEGAPFVFIRMNLTTFRIEKVATTGTPPFVSQTTAFEFHFSNNDAHVITRTSVTSLNMNTLHWGEPRIVRGMPPPTLTGSSHFSMNNTVFCMPFFNGDQKNNVYEICLDSDLLSWEKKEMVSVPSAFDHARDCHIFRRYGDKFVCIVMRDGSEVWFYDPQTRTWEIKESVGKRLGANHATNPSYVIVGDTLYYFGGTTTRNRLAFHSENMHPVQQLPPLAPVMQPPPAPVINPPAPVMQPPARPMINPPAPMMQPPARPMVNPPAPVIQPQVEPVLPQNIAGNWNNGQVNMLTKIDLKPRDVIVGEKKYAENLSKMYDTEYSDIKFIFEDGRSIVGHKVILCRSNARLKAMIGEKSEVIIKEHSFDVFQSFIKHFYNIDDLEGNNLFDIYNLAFEFSEELLKQKIEKILHSGKVSPLDVLCFFENPPNDEYKRLKRKALDDCVNQSKKICTGDKFGDFVKNNPTLASELFVAMTKTKPFY